MTESQLQTLYQLKELEEKSRTSKNSTYREWKFYKGMLERFVLECNESNNE